MRINTFNNVNKLTLKGKIIAFPTDTVYGIGALIDDEVAIKKIYNLKKRNLNKPLAVLAASIDDILPYVEEIRPDVDFRNITTLVTDGFIDSFDIVSIIASIEDEFAVEIPVDSMVAENFESAAAIMNLVNGVKK